MTSGLVSGVYTSSLDGAATGGPEGAAALLPSNIGIRGSGDEVALSGGAAGEATGALILLHSSQCKRYNG